MLHTHTVTMLHTNHVQLITYIHYLNEKGNILIALILQRYFILVTSLHYFVILKYFKNK